MNYSLHYIILMSLVGEIFGHNTQFLSQELAHSISVSYVRDRTVNKVTWQCLQEMYPSYRYTTRDLPFSRSDVPCIMYCMLRKFGIMNYGDINVNKYEKLVSLLHNHDPRIVISDVGRRCARELGRSSLDQCNKAMKFVECTKLFILRFRDGY